MNKFISQLSRQEIESGIINNQNYIVSNYEELNEFKNSKQLIPGCYYLIQFYNPSIDYTNWSAITAQAARTGYSILLQALESNVFSTNAYLLKWSMNSSGMILYSLSDYDIQFSFDNKFFSTEGFITWMRNRVSGNEASYDYVHLYYNDTKTITGNNNKIISTNNNGKNLPNIIINGNNNILNNCERCNISGDNNVLNNCFDIQLTNSNLCNLENSDNITITDSRCINGKYILENTISTCSNICFGFECSGNTLSDSENLIFGNVCEDNTIKNTKNLIFGNSCKFNNIEYGESIIFGNQCNNNTLKPWCINIVFQNLCCNNELADNCTNITFGNWCSFNNIAEKLKFSSFGNYCSYNVIPKYCSYITFGNGCQANKLNYIHSNNIELKSMCSYIEFNVTGIVQVMSSLPGGVEETCGLQFITIESSVFGGKRNFKNQDSEFEWQNNDETAPTLVLNFDEASKSINYSTRVLRSKSGEILFIND